MALIGIQSNETQTAGQALPIYQCLIRIIRMGFIDSPTLQVGSRRPRCKNTQNVGSREAAGSCVSFFLWLKIKTCFDAVGMFVIFQKMGKLVRCDMLRVAFDVRPTHFKHFPSQTWDKSSMDPQTTWKKKAVWPVLLYFFFTRQSPFWAAWDQRTTSDEMY